MNLAPVFKEIMLPPNIIEYLDGSSNFARGTTSSAKGKESPVRSTDICFRDQEDWVGKFCRHHVQVINEDFFKYHLNDGFDNGKYQYAHYHVNDHYGWHQDNIPDLPWDRKLSFSLLLNDDYQGGHLEFVEPLYEGDLRWNINRIKVTAGLLVVFPSMLGHRVTPVTKGIRKSIVGWCVGRQFT